MVVDPRLSGESGGIAIQGGKTSRLVLGSSGNRILVVDSCKDIFERVGMLDLGWRCFMGPRVKDQNSEYPAKWESERSFNVDMLKLPKTWRTIRLP